MPNKSNYQWYKGYNACLCCCHTKLNKAHVYCDECLVKFRKYNRECRKRKNKNEN